MSPPPPTLIPGTVHTDNCTLHYLSTPNTGNPLLIFIPGGNGHGLQYHPILHSPLLTPHYTLATYDRRQMSASTSTLPTPFNPAQQARDILAIIAALGFTSASLFASSGGGIIALQLALSFPASLRTLVLHETPTTSLLPPGESTGYMDFSFRLLEVYKEKGVEEAMGLMHRELMEPGGMGNEVRLRDPGWGNQKNQLENEIPWMGIYCPDLVRVVENGCSIVVAYGSKSRDAMYVRTTKVLAERLGCERVMFPGHHQGFESEPEEFAEVLLRVLEKAEGKRLAKQGV